MIPRCSPFGLKFPSYLLTLSDLSLFVLSLFVFSFRSLSLLAFWPSFSHLFSHFCLFFFNLSSSSFNLTSHSLRLCLCHHSHQLLFHASLSHPLVFSDSWNIPWVLFHCELWIPAIMVTINCLNRSETLFSVETLLWTWKK